MSGYKLASLTITSENFERFFEATNDIKSMPEPSAEFNHYVGLQSAEILQTNLDHLQTRQEAFDSALANVNENIRSFERDTSQALSGFETEMFAQTEQYVG